MAYMNQEKKAKIQTALKPVLAKYKVKGSLSVRNHSTIVLTLKSGEIDFISNMNRVCSSNSRQVSHGFRTVSKDDYININQYWYKEHFDGKAKEFLDEAYTALKSAGWYDDSDAMTDYFDTAYYCDIQIGKWNKPYVLA